MVFLTCLESTHGLVLITCTILKLEKITENKTVFIYFPIPILLLLYMDSISSQNQRSNYIGSIVSIDIVIIDILSK